MSATEPTTEATGEPTSTNDQLQRLEEAAQLLDASPEIGTLDLETRAPNPTTHTFRRWLEGKRGKRRREYDDGTFQHPVEHAYSYKAERAKFGRVKDVGRHFVKEHDTFTTVLITYTKPLESGQTIAEHATGLLDKSLKRTRRDCIKKAGGWEEYAGVSLLAPKEGTDVAPTPITHIHDNILLPGFAPSEAFDPLRRRDGVHVSIRYHRSEKVSTPSAINRQDLERERGPTTALAQEVGANLPVLTAIESYREAVAKDSCENSAALKATLDASDCPKYVEDWCAHMRLGKDGDIGTPGVRRWRELGRFREIADNAHSRRKEKVCAEGVGAQDLNQKEREFVEGYVSEVGDPNPAVIIENVDKNISQFPESANAKAIRREIQERLKK